MKTINIGNRWTSFFVEDANTNYVLKKGDVLQDTSYALFMTDDLKNVRFEIDGHIKATAGGGVSISTDKPSAAVVFDVSVR